MKSFEDARLNIPEGSPLARMLAEAAKKRGSKKLRKSYERSLERRTLTPLDLYEQKVSESRVKGHEGLRPCSFLDLKPGARVLDDDSSGVVKWGLTDGETHQLVVKFDKPRCVLPGGEKSNLLIVNPKNLRRDNRYQRYKKKG